MQLYLRENNAAAGRRKKLNFAKYELFNNQNDMLLMNCFVFDFVLLLELNSLQLMHVRRTRFDEYILYS